MGTYNLNLDWQFFQYRHTLDDKLKLKQISHLQQAFFFAVSFLGYYLCSLRLQMDVSKIVLKPADRLTKSISFD